MRREVDPLLAFGVPAARHKQQRPDREPYLPLGPQSDRHESTGVGPVTMSSTSLGCLTANRLRRKGFGGRSILERPPTPSVYGRLYAVCVLSVLPI
jgi:hypothetical protein